MDMDELPPEGLQVARPRFAVSRIGAAMHTLLQTRTLRPTLTKRCVLNVFKRNGHVSEMTTVPHGCQDYCTHPWRTVMTTDEGRQPLRLYEEFHNYDRFSDDVISMKLRRILVLRGLYNDTAAPPLNNTLHPLLHVR